MGLISEGGSEPDEGVIKGEVVKSVYYKTMTTKQMEKIKIKQMLLGSTATADQIAKAMSDYFKKYTLKEIPDNDKITASVTAEALSIFDGNVFEGF